MFLQAWSSVNIFRLRSFGHRQKAQVDLVVQDLLQGEPQRWDLELDGAAQSIPIATHLRAIIPEQK